VSYVPVFCFCGPPSVTFRCLAFCTAYKYPRYARNQAIGESECKGVCGSIICLAASTEDDPIAWWYSVRLEYQGRATGWRRSLAAWHVIPHDCRARFGYSQVGSIERATGKIQICTSLEDWSMAPPEISALGECDKDLGSGGEGGMMGGSGVVKVERVSRHNGIWVLSTALNLSKHRMSLIYIPRIWCRRPNPAAPWVNCCASENMWEA